MHQSEEDLLVLAAQDGDQKAFATIFKRYHKPLLSYAIKFCNDPELAKDATQETWIKLAKNIRKLDDPRALRSWLYKTVNWRLIDLVRSSNRHQVNTQALDEDHHGEPHHLSVDEGSELLTAIAQLATVEKQMIHMFYLDDFKVNEIAVVLGIPSGTVKSRLNRARKVLRQKLSNTTLGEIK